MAKVVNKYLEYKEVNEELFQKYNEPSLVINNISKYLLIEILNNNDFYNYVITVLKRYTQDTIIINFNNEKITITIVDLVNSYKEILPSLNSQQKMNVALILSLTSLESAYKYYNNQEFKMTIDDEVVRTEINNLLDLLIMREEDFLNLNSKKEIYGLKLEIIYTLLTEFIKEEHILTRYVFENNNYLRYKEIANKSLISLKNTNDKEELTTVTVPPEIENYIKKELIYSSPLESAILIYIALCHCFRASDNFINIYASYLANLGIDYVINKDSLIFFYMEYKIKCGKNIKEDIKNVKEGNIATNLKCLNTSTTLQKFKEKLLAICENFNDKHGIISKIPLEEKNKIDRLSKKEKLVYLLKELATLDSHKINEQKKIFMRIFNEDNHVNINFISKNDNYYMTIITFLSNQGYNYFCLKVDNFNKVYKMDENNLKKILENTEYMVMENKKIPGLS